MDLAILMLDWTVSHAVFLRDNFKCRHCGERRLHPHHVIFKSHGGPDTLNNLISLCPSCHAALHDGKLKLEVLQLYEYDLSVKFTRVGKWKPV